MSESKSKFPDMKELSLMASKLIKGLKKSVEEIIQDFKEKRATNTTSHKPTPKTKAHTSTHAKPKPTKTSHDKPKAAKKPAKTEHH